MRIFKNNLRSALMLAVALIYTSVVPKSLTTTTQPPVAQPSVALAPAEQEDLGKKRVGLVREESLARVQKEQERRAGIDTRSLQEVQEATGPNRFTQTEAYFQVPDLRSAVAKEFTGPFEVVRYMDIVSRVMAKEAEFRNSHWVFYHGISNVWTVWQDTLTKLSNHFNPSAQKEGGDFVFLRTRTKENKQAKEFLINELKENGLVDDNGESRGLLLSTNLSLFGNTGLGSESTWRYIMKEKKHTEPDRAMYESIMDEWGLPYTFINELKDLVSLLKTKQQTLLQIFVPKEIVDDIGYLAWATGIPAHQKSIDWVRTNIKNRTYVGKKGKPGALWALAALKDKFKKEQERNPLFKEMLANVEDNQYSLNAYLKDYCNKPLEVPNMNYIQARLIFTDDILLNPASGVKMFRHTEIEHKKMKAYESRLNEIIQQIIAEKK